MSVEKRGVKRKKMNATHGAMIAILFMVCAILVALFINSLALSNKISGNEARINELKELISDETERSSEIDNIEEYMQSDEYLEQEAKEKLGFVKDGEIIFKENK